jgi:rare lipoprotein A
LAFCLLAVIVASTACSPAGRASVRPGHDAWLAVASWYGPKYHGRRTANGEVYDMNGLSAAHRTLPFGTKLRVTSLSSRRSVVVRVNDRGPFIDGRDLDLSYGAAKEIGLVHEGVAKVKIERVR